MSSRDIPNGLKKKEKSRRSRRRRRRNPKKEFVETRSSKGGVEERLQILKELIHGEGDMKADKIFQETADYIVFLRTQVHVLQRLVDFYDPKDKDVVVL